MKTLDELDREVEERRETIRMSEILNRDVAQAESSLASITKALSEPETLTDTLEAMLRSCDEIPNSLLTNGSGSHRGVTVGVPGGLLASYVLRTTLSDCLIKVKRDRRSLSERLPAVEKQLIEARDALRRFESKRLDSVEAL